MDCDQWMRPVARFQSHNPQRPRSERRVHAGADAGALGFASARRGGLGVEGEAEQAQHAGGGEQ